MEVSQPKRILVNASVQAKPRSSQTTVTMISSDSTTLSGISSSSSNRSSSTVTVTPSAAVISVATNQQHNNNNINNNNNNNNKNKILLSAVSPSLPPQNGTLVKNSSSNNCRTPSTTVLVQKGEYIKPQQQLITNQTQGHVVKIQINSQNKGSTVQLIQNYETIEKNNNKNKSIVQLTSNDKPLGSVRINVNTIEKRASETVLKNSTMPSSDLLMFQKQQTGNGDNNTNGQFFLFQCSPTNLIMSSGQCSPSDTLDSGTCSDLDSTPPPLPKKKNKKQQEPLSNNSSVHNHSGAESSSDDSESNVSCDSLNSTENNIVKTHNFPCGLLKDIRNRNVKLTTTTSDPLTSPPIVASVLEKLPPHTVADSDTKKPLVHESTYADRQLQDKSLENGAAKNCYVYETDCFYKFHLNENVIEDNVNGDNGKNGSQHDDETFAGYKDLLGGGNDPSSTIRSAKGTIRGVKNRVRAGIATFLQIQQLSNKSYKEKDAGKVVVYSTTMGIVRETYQQCLKVKQILRTHLVKFEERDVFMSSEYQSEIRDRMNSEHILVPQVFVDGQHIGDMETIERLNESGELRRILKPYKSADACSTCQVCGGYRLLPCPVCNGSKKSVHRNHFTTEFVALKCMNCDEVGLVRCYNC